MNAPVLLIIYNRSNSLRRVIQKLRDQKIEKIYIAADGPNREKEGDVEKVLQARKVLEEIDWDCKVYKLYREINIGCKQGVAEGLNWFFENEECGIILEDDCLPNESFWLFCNELLEKYKDNYNVMTISGTNSQDGVLRGEATYYFSRYNHVWGWATWRRAWINYNGNLAGWKEYRKSASWKELFKDPIERNYWEDIFDEISYGKKKWDAWDYPWTFSIWKINGINIMPNYNLVSNIGFGLDATHTKDANSSHANQRTLDFDKLTHPNKIEICENADNTTFNVHFGGQGQRSFKYRIRRKLKKIFRNLREFTL